MVTLPPAAAIAPNPPAVAAFVRDHKLTRYAVALTDLNGDGRPEALIYAMDAGNSPEGSLCRSGGCELYVLSRTAKDYRVVTDITLTRPPIRVLPEMRHGWHDLAVWIGGGGIIPGYEVRLRFDGRTYPENPTVPPATRLKSRSGKVIIGALPSPRR